MNEKKPNFNIKKTITKLSLFIFLGVFFFSLKTFAAEYKSIVFDFADNWGNTDVMGVREIGFYKNGVKTTMIENTDFTALAFQTYKITRPASAFDTRRPIVGAGGINQWYATITRKNRLIFTAKKDFDFDELILNNLHHYGNGSDADRMGVKNTKIYLSKKEITDTTYGAGTDDMELIFNEELPKHSITNTEQNYKIPITKSGTITMKNNPDNSSNSGSSESGDSSSGGSSTGGTITNSTGTSNTEVMLTVYEGAITIGSTGSINLGRFKISSTAQDTAGTFTDNFWVEDLKGADKGRYTTLQSSAMVNQEDSSITIPASNIKMKSPTVLTTIAGFNNSRIIIDSAWSSYHAIDSAQTFIHRDNGNNKRTLGKYGVKPSIQITIPAYQAIGTYKSILTYTLIEK